MVRMSYPEIDMNRTGEHIRYLMSVHGYDVKDIQEILQLSCPQPIYRWLKGQILPSVNHLLVLSRLFRVHMEELLIERSAAEIPIDRNGYMRLGVYYHRIMKITVGRKDNDEDYIRR